MKNNELCVVSMSGGLDSSTLFAKALSEGKTCLPVNFNYGQKNIVEMTAQQNVWKHFKQKFPDQVLDTIVIDFTSIIGDAIGTFQKNRDNGKAEESTEMTYYMPSRNLLFMTMSAVIGEILANDQDITKLSLGLGIHQHSDIYAKDYWDISPEFAEKLQDLLSLNDNLEVTIYAPYKDGRKSEIIKDMELLNVPFGATWTCYNPRLNSKIYDSVHGNIEEYAPCLECEACLERASQAEIVGVEDINEYCTLVYKDK
jgi:7-cyano-7-deazaguanine synthase